MSEKTSTDILDNAGDAKATTRHEDVKSEIIDDPGRRRKSVALNIVENPLKVSFCHVRGQALHGNLEQLLLTLHLYSAPPGNRMLPMPERLPQHMAWLSTLSSSAVLLSLRASPITSTV